MASISRLFFSNLFLTISIVVFLFLPMSVDGISEQELQNMVYALRERGYKLFGNAIMTSDLRYEILAGKSFTLFAPTDSALFALDMTATASDYVQNLRFHIAISRFSITNLRSLPSGSYLCTLFPRHDLKISGRLSSESYIFTVNGVDIVLPGLFYSKDIAVHGLGGILNPRFQIGSLYTPPPPPAVPSGAPIEEFSRNESFRPSMNGLISSESESPSGRISPEYSSESQDLSPMIITPIANSPGFPPIQSCADGFCPAKTESVAPASLFLNDFFPFHSPSPNLDPSSKPSEVRESEIEKPTEIGRPAMSPIFSFTKESAEISIPATAPVISWSFNANTVECPVPAFGEELGNISLRRDKPHTLEHLTNYFS